MSEQTPDRLYGHAYALMYQVAGRKRRHADDDLQRALVREDIKRSPHAEEAKRLGLLTDDGLTEAGELEVEKGHPGMHGRVPNTR